LVFNEKKLIKETLVLNHNKAKFTAVKITQVEGYIYFKTTVWETGHFNMNTFSLLQRQLVTVIYKQQSSLMPITVAVRFEV
jgi:folate-dependent tRNA-U54 methylase TrmFO/GidA